MIISSVIIIILIVIIISYRDHGIKTMEINSYRLCNISNNIRIYYLCLIASIQVILLSTILSSYELIIGDLLLSYYLTYCTITFIFIGYGITYPLVLYLRLDGVLLLGIVISIISHIMFLLGEGYNICVIISALSGVGNGIVLCSSFLIVHESTRRKQSQQYRYLSSLSSSMIIIMIIVMIMVTSTM